jgi:hypothetical protein
MTSLRWTARIAVVAIALAMTSPLLAQSGPSTAAVTNQLKTVFDKADLDHDTFLDKTELAKSFRGPKATVPTQGMYDDQGRFTKTYYDAPKKYPDLVLLWAADKDGDDRLSWPEYRDYQLKLFNDRQQQQRALQRSLQSANRSYATRSRRTGSYRGTRTRTRTVYRRSRVYSRPASRARSYQYSMASQQRQMAQAMQNWQRYQMQMMANYQRAYQQAVLQRVQAQQRMMNYMRQQAAAHRIVQQHRNAVVHRRRAPVVRRRR